MITSKQINIFGFLAESPFKEYTRKKIKECSKEKSNNLLALTVNALKKEDVLTEEKIGKSGLLKLNLNNDLTFDYISIANHHKIPLLVKSSLDLLKKEILEETPFFSVVIFGSYVSKTQTKNSDLDIAIFIENESNKKKLQSIVNSVKLKSKIELDTQIISKEEMLEMLASKQENLGKQIAKKHLAVYNPKIFYEIIKEGMNHGFRI